MKGTSLITAVLALAVLVAAGSEASADPKEWTVGGTTISTEGNKTSISTDNGSGGEAKINIDNATITVTVEEGAVGEPCHSARANSGASLGAVLNDFFQQFNVNEQEVTDYKYTAETLDLLRDAANGLDWSATETICTVVIVREGNYCGEDWALGWKVCLDPDGNVTAEPFMDLKGEPPMHIVLGPALNVPMGGGAGS